MSATLPMSLLLPLTATSDSSSTTTTTTATIFTSSDIPSSRTFKSPPNPSFSFLSSSNSSSTTFSHHHQHSFHARRNPPPSVSNKTLVFTNDLLPGTVFVCTGLLALWTYEKRSRHGQLEIEEENAVGMFGSDKDAGTQIPTQIQSLVEGSGTVMVSEYKLVPDVLMWSIYMCAISLSFSCGFL
ncbi:hypothetical protein LWI28_009271 [Acer negundo]|uniref:Uncharacterized protein n=1 Tax=Acer negundo TaxID=4023 RepID=A0AAD5NFF1_ACENE|nr:hypothetical protein LWI28_009271 [Acer negundo]